MSTLELKVYEIFKNKLGEKEAETVIEYIEVKAEEKYQQKKDVLLTKEDKIDIIRSVYTAIFTAHIIQFLATIGSVLAIMQFMVKK